MINQAKKIGMLGSIGSVHGAAFLSTKDLLKKVGQNTGNLFFQYAVYHLIKDEKLIVGVDTSWDPSEIRERCRLLVIPSANFLRENFDLTEFVNFLDSCRLPLLFLGLGVQADSYSKTHFDFHPSIIKLIAIIRDQAIGVGVRGEFTAELLERYSVANVEIIGCPTNFVNSDSAFVEKLEAKWMGNADSLIATGDEPWPKSLDKQSAERKLFSLAYKMFGVYVQQSVEPFVCYLRRSNSSNSDNVDSRLEDSLRAALAPTLDLLEFRRFMSARVRLYISIDQWLEEASRFDISLGLRLHGNMVAFQSGCPAIWIHHDSRTQELVESMCLPSLSLQDFLESDGVEDMKLRSNFSFSDYAARRVLLRSRLDSLLSKNYVK